MVGELLIAVYIFVLAVFVGFEVIAKVPTLLHTPLMSGSNAISGIAIIGAIVIAGRLDEPFNTILGVIAVAFGAINVVGGFLVTDRMLRMFKRKPDESR
jgi:NAD(P) transhydrogenase subunit alpha